MKFKVFKGVFGGELRVPDDTPRCAKCGGIHKAAAAPRPSAPPSAVALAGLVEERVPAKPTLERLTSAITAHRATVTTPEPKRNLQASFAPPRPVAPEESRVATDNNAGTVPVPSFTALVERIKAWRR